MSCSVIFILLIGGNNIPSNDPLPDKKAVVDALIELFDRLNGIEVWAVHICEIMQRYPYDCSPRDIRSKELSPLTEKINSSLGSKLASRDPHTKVNLFWTIWDREAEVDNCTSRSSGVCSKSNHTRLLCRDHVHLTTAGYMWLRDRLSQIDYMTSKDLYNGMVPMVMESPKHKTHQGKKTCLEDDKDVVPSTQSFAAFFSVNTQCRVIATRLIFVIMHAVNIYYMV